MVRVLLAVVADNRTQLLEAAGVALIVVFVGLACGWPWPLLALGVAALLKSAEVDARNRARQTPGSRR